MEDEKSAVGYRFKPNDEELVDHYLKHKVDGIESQVRIIPELNICDFEPWELPAKSIVKSDDPYWYFFCPRHPKYSTGKGVQRSTRTGHWKVTGKVQKVVRRKTKEIIGTKRILSFLKGKPGGPEAQNTNWGMHEYSLVNSNLHHHQRPYVVCQISSRGEVEPEGNVAEPSGNVAEPIGNVAEPSGTVASSSESRVEEGRIVAEPSGIVAEPSIIVASNSENHVEEGKIAKVYDHQEPDLEPLLEQPQDLDFSILRSLMQEEHGFPDVGSSFADCFINYNYDGLQLQSGTCELEEDASFDLNTAEPQCGGEFLPIQALPDYSTPAESLRREYVEDSIVSSDTDAEHRRDLESMYEELAVLIGYERAPKICTLSETPSSSCEWHKSGKNVAGYEFERPNASSSGSAGDNYHSIMSLDFFKAKLADHTHEPHLMVISTAINGVSTRKIRLGSGKAFTWAGLSRKVVSQRRARKVAEINDLLEKMAI